eukprot:511902_1
MLHVLLLSFHLFCSTITHAMSYGSWQTGGSMPLRNDMMAIGYDDTNDTIWLLGGSEASKQLLAFDIHTQTFIQNQTGLSHGFSGDHYFTQIGHILWMIGGFDAAQTFSIFNVITAQFSYDYNHIAIPVQTREPGCLASTIDDNHNSYLFAVGGKNASNKALDLTQIYNISSNSWLENVPSMQTNRASFSCIVQNNKLFSIGGWTSTAPYYLDSIEVLDVSTTNLYNNFMIKWQYIDSLNEAAERTNAVRYMDKVLVIGGASPTRLSNAIHVIDPVSDTVTYYDESLATAVRNSASVVVDGALFVFGGSTPGVGWGIAQTWQYTTLSTPTPTISTKEPTIIPTSAPTLLPTVYPTFMPLPNPTETPTIATMEPTVIPTRAPTLLPTVRTGFPTIVPTLLPSSSPTVPLTDLPTNTPTLFPSIHPTILPIITATVLPIVVAETRQTTSRLWGNTTNTLSIAIDTAGTGDDWSFIYRMVGHIGVVNITIAVSGVCCVLMGCFLVCKLKENNKLKHIIQEQSDNNRPRVPKQATGTLTPPGVGGTSVSLPEYTISVNVDDSNDVVEASVSLSMEGVPNLSPLEAKEEDGVSQESRDDSEQMYVIHKPKPDASTPSDGIDCELKTWLIVNGFAHYLDNFTLHGYDSLDFVKDIEDVQDLIAIGIIHKSDQRKLMSLIAQLCNDRSDNMDHENTAMKDGEAVAMHVQITSK